MEDIKNGYVYKLIYNTNGNRYKGSNTYFNKKEQYTCICGKILNKGQKNKHEPSKFHINYIINNI